MEENSKARKRVENTSGTVPFCEYQSKNGKTLIGANSTPKRVLIIALDGDDKDFPKDPERILKIGNNNFSH